MRVKIRDISASGVGFISHEHLNVGLCIDCRLPQQSGEWLDIKLKVRRCAKIASELYSVGATFEAVAFCEAGDGLGALSVISVTPGGFDLMIVDWNMPNMDGITLVKKVRETDKKTILIMATTEAEKARVLDAIRAGVNNYIVKPFTPEGLLEKVSQTIAKAGAKAA